MSTGEKLLGKTVRHRNDNIKCILKGAVQRQNSIQKLLLFTHTANSTRFIRSLNGSVENLTKRLMSYPG